MDLWRGLSRYLGFRFGEVATYDATKGHRTTASHTRGKVRVFVRKVAATVVTDHIETRDRVAFRVDSVHVSVDLDTITSPYS